jgi:hypothetical protein
MIPEVVIALITLQLIDNRLVPQKNGYGMRLFVEGRGSLVFPTIPTHLRLLVPQPAFRLSGREHVEHMENVALSQRSASLFGELNEFFDHAVWLH